jgi:hypothetical protein
LLSCSPDLAIILRDSMPLFRPGPSIE